jgi:hypothetical protein
MGANSLEVEKMLMSFRAVQKAANLGGSGHTYDLYYKEDKIPRCQFITWGFRSCAAAIIQNFGGGFYSNPWTDEMVEDLLKLMTDKEKQLGTYTSREAYFLLGVAQHSSATFSKLIKHPNVRQLDLYSNKAHDGNKVKLFRISVENDYPNFRESKQAQVEAPIPRI